MGINDLLKHLPGGRSCDYHHSFYELDWQNRTVPLDAASALWQFAANHAWDHIRGNHTPALREWAHFLVYLRSICGWKLLVFMDGMENPHKQPEIERRRKQAQKAKENNNSMGQIKNTPDYIAEATKICNHLQIEVRYSAYEADPQTAYVAMKESAIAVTGDSDLLAYGVSKKPKMGKLVVVKGFKHEWYRVIDLELEANVKEGEYPLFDLYKEHGTIVLQLYAACSGCDFTNNRNGISGVGFSTFISVAENIDGELSVSSLASALWENEEDLMKKAELLSISKVEEHLQRIVDIYQHGHVYDKHSNIIDMGTGEIIKTATAVSKQHMAGNCNSRTREEYENDLVEKLNKMRVDQLVKLTAAAASEIRGVSLPANKTPEQCTVAQLRDFVAARGGKISMTKPELISATKQYLFVEKEVGDWKDYVNRNPNPNGLLFAKLDTSGTRSVH